MRGSTGRNRKKGLEGFVATARKGSVDQRIFLYRERAKKKDVEGKEFSIVQHGQQCCPLRIALLSLYSGEAGTQEGGTMARERCVP